MTDTLEAPTTADAAAARVDAAIDELLASHDPKQLSYAEFRGAQFDAGLAWVYFDEGHGGLSVRPSSSTESRSGCGQPAPGR